MTDTMTAAEYAAATNEVRHNQSILAAAELAATRAAIRKLRTAAGRLDMMRRAQPRAKKLIDTATMAANIAELARLERESLEAQEVGRQRLAAATAEIYGTTPEKILPKPKRPRGRPRKTPNP